MKRRKFIKSAAASGLAINFVPSTVWGANERIGVAAIGCDGKGTGEVIDVSKAGGTIVGLCDVDSKRGGKVRQMFPKAKFYQDFRVMLEKENKNIDAVTISTPDHMHAYATVMAMNMGKHVYTQKPMAHSIWEARTMRKVATSKGLATQMGNQAHSGEGIRRAVELVRAGVVGKVHEVHTWTNRPIWPQGMKEMPAAQAVPESLDWDMWIGPAPMRPYNGAYLPFKWRGWWDFGTGALGDMGCHIMDMPFWALDLKYPTAVEAESKGCTELSGPLSSKVTWHFPDTQFCKDLKFHWYDGNGGNQRMPDKEVFEGTPFNPGSAKKFDGILIGEKGKFLFNRGSTRYFTAPENLLTEVGATKKTVPRVPNEDKEWIDAIRAGNPDLALSNFKNSGPFTETVLLGNLAIRLGKKIEWDGEKMHAKNAPEAASLVKRDYRKGWEIEPVA